MTRIFFSAGEPSGVNIGASLMRTLKKRIPDVSFAGLGGPAMVDEGMDLIYDPARTATMWLWGNLKRVPEHRRALRQSVESWKTNRPDLVITIDYQAFHLFLGRAAKELGIPVLHYVSSQFWGRRYWTLEPIRRAYDHVLCIHAFEKRHYDEAGIPATFVGHPLLERLEHRSLDRALMDRLAALPGPRIGLLPGSRRGEILTNLPTMLDAARQLHPAPRLLVSCGRADSRAFIDDTVRASGLEVEVVDLGAGEILSVSKIAIITSGSASMEAVYYGCPCVIVYRLGKLNYFFAKPHIASYIGQPNLIAGEEIAPEFLLCRPSGTPVATAAQRLLDDEKERDHIRARFADMRAKLLEGAPPSERAADVAESMLRSAI